MRPDLAADAPGITLDPAGQRRVLAIAAALDQVAVLVEGSDPGIVRGEPLGQLLGILAGALADAATGMPPVN